MPSAVIPNYDVILNQTVRNENLQTEIYHTISDPRQIKLFESVPMGRRYQCRLIRKKEASSMSTPQYWLYLDSDVPAPDSDAELTARSLPTNMDNQMLLCAQRRRVALASHYDISQHDFCTGLFVEGCVGSVQSNFLGTAFTIRRSVQLQTVRKESRIANNNGDSSIKDLESAVVLYQPNILGLRGPRKMTLITGSASSKQNNSTELWQVCFQLVDSTNRLYE